MLKDELEVDTTNVSTIKTLLPLTIARGVRSFLGHVGLKVVHKRLFQDCETVMQVSRERCSVCF